MSGHIALRLKRPGFTLDVDFALETGGVTALFGASGAGKSTIIQAMTGLVRPDQGRIEIGGETLFDSAKGIDVAPQARRLGVVFQDARLFPHLSVENNLLYGARRNGGTNTGDLDRIVTLLGIAHILRRRPITLSGGERSRVALGRALLMQPKALILDEPMAALDSARKAEILPYLEHLRDETRIPILYVSHSIEEVTRLADRMIVLDQGSVIASGSVFEMTARLDLASFRNLPPGTILEAAVTAHDAAHHLSNLNIGGETLVVPAVSREVGDKVRIRIEAQDVMLALQRPEGISANNILSASIAEIRDAGTHADIRLDIGTAHILARITTRSRERLDLSPGMRVFAVIKSVTVGARDNRAEN